VFENRVLRGIFGPRKNEIIVLSRKVHCEELLNLNSSSNTIRMIKSRRMNWVRHVACMGNERNAYRFYMGKAEERRPLL
jgi:hypothetical protein